MRHAVFASAVLTFTLAQPALAQLGDKPVPMDKAPFHIPVFQNDWIILLNVNIPPGRNTGYHIHYADSVSVNLMPASQTNQNYGSNEVSAPGTGGEGAPGRATFTNVTKEGPRTHKATNIGPTPFHNISFVFRNRQPGKFTPAGRAEAPGYVRIIDNERVRGWRLALEPGQSAAPITQTAPGIRIVLDGGELVESVPGQADRGWMLATGEFYWQDAGVTRGLRNMGTTRIEIVEFEIK